VVILALVLLIGATRQSTPSEIKAYSFVVMGIDGKKRVELGGILPGLDLYGADGKVRVHLGLHDKYDDPRLTLQDESGQVEATLELRTGSTMGKTPAFVAWPQLSLSSKDGFAKLEPHQNSTFLSLISGKEETEKVHLGTYNGLARLDLTAGPRDPERVRKAEKEWAGHPRDKSLAKSLVDGNHITLMADDAKTRIILWDAKGVPRLQLGQTDLALPKEVVEKRPVSSVTLFDKDGNLIWKAP
jgi:hypothetical protein